MLDCWQCRTAPDTAVSMSCRSRKGMCRLTSACSEAARSLKQLDASTLGGNSKWCTSPFARTCLPASSAPGAILTLKGRAGRRCRFQEATLSMWSSNSWANALVPAWLRRCCRQHTINDDQCTLTLNSTTTHPIQLLLGRRVEPSAQQTSVRRRGSCTHVHSTCTVE